MIKIIVITSKCMDPLTPLTLIYDSVDSVTLPIMCKCMYRKSSRNITCNTALNDNVISYSKQIIVKKNLASETRL